VETTTWGVVCELAQFSETTAKAWPRGRCSKPLRYRAPVITLVTPPVISLWRCPVVGPGRVLI